MRDFFQNVRQIVDVFQSYYISKFLSMLGPIRIHSDLFGSIRMRLDVFGCLWKRFDVFGNFNIFVDFSRSLGAAGLAQT